jgi:hypothetical protein
MGEPVTGGAPRLVEIVGPAGGGKTALLRTLARDPRIRAGLRIDRGRHLPEMLRHTVALIPTALGLLRNRPASMQNGLLHFVRLRTLPSVVMLAMAEEPARTILLDEGPVFSLGRLSVFQGADRTPGVVRRQWHAELDRWATLLDTVILVDATDAVLRRRIRERPKEHQIKDRSDAEMAGFLERYRQAYREILSAMTMRGKVRVVELDTTHASAEASANRVIGELERLGLSGAA